MTDAIHAPGWRNRADYDTDKNISGAMLRWEILRRHPSYREAFDADRVSCGLRFGIAGDAPHYSTRWNALPDGFAFAPNSLHGPVKTDVRQTVAEASPTTDVQRRLAAKLQAMHRSAESLAWQTALPDLVDGHRIDVVDPVALYQFDLSRPLKAQLDDASVYLSNLQRQVQASIEAAVSTGRETAARRKKTSSADGSQDCDRTDVGSPWSAVFGRLTTLSGRRGKLLDRTERRVGRKPNSVKEQLAGARQDESLEPAEVQIRNRTPDVVKLLRAIDALEEVATCLDDPGSVSREIVDAIFDGKKSSAWAFLNETIPAWKEAAADRAKWRLVGDG
jgi:hypothetical protein